MAAQLEKSDSTVEDFMSVHDLNFNLRIGDPFGFKRTADSLHISGIGQDLDLPDQQDDAKDFSGVEDFFYNPSLALLRKDYSLGPRHAGSPTHGQPSRPIVDQHLPNGMTQ